MGLRLNNIIRKMPWPHRKWSHGHHVWLPGEINERGFRVWTCLRCGAVRLEAAR